ncbi:MAG: hypothetical protein ISS48_04700, partial [Candidatus Aenigmarchaeota archaeon]|nr:hypothetical protein [Candidatus Aenigmarchaeota archaeon]
MFKSCWKKIIITLLLIFTIHVSITSSVAANSIQRTLPDTTEDIHLYLVDWTSQIPPIEIIGEIDLLTHLMPDPEIPEDQPNTVELVHQMNPDLPILQYKCLVCEPNGPFCHRIPWGSDPDITRISEWQDANKHEGMFFHSTNPASLTIIPGDGNVNLYWSKDKRGIIPDLNFEVIGYNIYRRTESGSFQKVNTQVITSTSFTDIGLENGERYFYLVKSVNQGGRDYYFSDLVDVRPTASFPTQLLYHQDFEVGFTRTGDSFHQIPVGCQGDFTFKVSALGSPRSVKLYFDYNSDKNFEDTEDGQEIYEMNFQDGNYKIDIINLEIDLNKWNGFAYYFEAQYGADTIKFPSKNAFTTNINNRLRSRLWGNYFPDPGSQVWRDFYVKWAKNWSDQYGYDGVFVDVAGWRGRNFINNHVETYPRDFVNLEQFEEEFDNNQKGMLAYIKNNLDPMLVMFNGFDHLSIEGDRYNLGDYLELVDGGMIEGFAHGGGFDHPPRHFYQTEAKWRDQLNQMINGNLAHNKVVLVLSKGFEDDDVQARVYSLTSYLLGKGDKSYFSTDTKRIFSRFPEQQISIDRPTQSFNSVDKYYLADKNVYKREFTNGLVFVNPSATVTSGTINLPRTYYKAEVTGGTVDEGGTIEYVPVNSIILSPHIGVILLSELPGTTTTSTTTTTTTTVSVTTTTSTTTTIPSCSLDSAYIICNCGSDNECSSGESISVYGSISGSCPIITHLQIDASNYDGACDMQYIRGDISGIYGDYPSLSG